MEKKSSGRGSRSVLRIITSTNEPCRKHGTGGGKPESRSTSMTSSDAMTQNTTSLLEGTSYGSKPWNVEGIKAELPMDSWLLYQLQSITGNRNLTMDEARCIAQQYNLTTRERIEPCQNQDSKTTRPPLWMRLIDKLLST